MITVAGEALIDIVVSASGSVTAVLGGAPFNVARTVARLGADCRFVGRLSQDPFGEQLRSALREAGVGIAPAPATCAPTTLAIAQLDEHGVADYRFYLDGTAAAQLRPEEIPPDVLDGASAFALGGVALTVEPTAASLYELLARTPPRTLRLLDPNCRPSLIGDATAYRRRLARFIARVDVLKVSVEDLATLRPGDAPGTAARRLLEVGPAAVLITDGPHAVQIHTATAERMLPVPVVCTVDTVGAGDAFVAGVLTGWDTLGRTRADAADADLLATLAAAAVQVSGAACTVRGAGLPAGYRWPGVTGTAPLTPTTAQARGA